MNALKDRIVRALLTNGPMCTSQLALLLEARYGTVRDVLNELEGDKVIVVEEEQVELRKEADALAQGALQVYRIPN